MINVFAKKKIWISLILLLLFTIGLQYAWFEHELSRLNEKLYIANSKTNLFILESLTTGKTSALMYISAISAESDIINFANRKKLKHIIDFSYLCLTWNKKKQLFIQGIKKAYEDRNITTQRLYENKDFEYGLKELERFCSSKIKGSGLNF